MCGIVGAIADRDVALVLLEGLKRLEYRGYDSAGLAIIDARAQLQCHRAVGKVNELEKLLVSKPLQGQIGIAHTRWATHGKPSDLNAHPHIANNEIAIVHNGIIENYEKLRARLVDFGCVLSSETDSELIAHLVYLHIQSGKNFLAAVQATITELEGAYAIGLLSRTEPNHFIAVRSGSPLVIGLGDQINFIASDQLALLPFTQQFIFLEEGDIADVRLNEVIIYDTHGNEVKRDIHYTKLDQEEMSKGKYQHFMQKEIFEQADSVIACLEGRLSYQRVISEAFGANANEIFKQIRHVQLVACGTSYHACLVGKYWLEEIAGISCQAEIASENRYRQHVVEPGTLYVTLSQSGETADTLAALRHAKTLGYAATLAICNVPESSLVRESDLVLMTGAGMEIGVASTKAFTTQLVALFLLTITLGRNSRIDQNSEAEYVKLLRAIPKKLRNTLMLDSDIKNLAIKLKDKNHVLFIGRGIEYPIALEGALKLKEISYIHAEAFPAGELKHGPIALIDSEMYAIALAPIEDSLDKLKSNLQEIRAREGKLIICTNEEAGFISDDQTSLLIMPHVHKFLAPLIYTIPMQLFAYHIAVMKGTDLDQPRNLAKSVTVE